MKDKTYVLYKIVYGNHCIDYVSVEGITHDKAVAEAYIKQPTCWSSYEYEEGEELTLDNIKDP